MSFFGRAKAKWDELLGRAEELYGETHGDAAAEVHGEALRLEGEAEEEAEEHHDAIRPPDDGTSAPR
jgi:uncharacterized protein YjbJ (UPF0337 family)